MKQGLSVPNSWLSRYLWVLRHNIKRPLFKRIKKPSKIDFDIVNNSNSFRVITKNLKKSILNLKFFTDSIFMILQKQKCEETFLEINLKKKCIKDIHRKLWKIKTLNSLIYRRFSLTNGK